MIFQEVLAGLDLHSYLHCRDLLFLPLIGIAGLCDLKHCFTYVTLVLEYLQSLYSTKISK